MVSEKKKFMKISKSCVQTIQNHVIIKIDSVIKIESDISPFLVG